MRRVAKVIGGVVLALLAFGATRLVTSGRWYRIPQNGMYPGLPAGSYLLVRPRPYQTASDARRGDIIVFTRVEHGAQYKYVWRVVGLPGDSIEAAAQRVVVNGVELQRKAVREDGGLSVFQESNGDASYQVAYPRGAAEREPPPVSTRVPAGQLFVLGDNRYNAVDSRYFGPVPVETVVGKMIWAP